MNVTDLMILGPSGTHPHSLVDTDWLNLFTKDRPIHFNYHGYPQELRGLLFGRLNLGDRVTIEGYREEGTTTSCGHSRSRSLRAPVRYVPSLSQQPHAR